MTRPSATPIRFVLVTLDAHLAGSVVRVRDALRADLPGLDLVVHVASDWPSDAAAAEACKRDLATADFIVLTQLFQEEQVAVVTEPVRARRDGCDLVVAMLCAPELTALTRMGKFAPSNANERSPWSPMALLRKLRGERKDGQSSGERQMAMLRRMPQILRWIPGTAQDLRAYLLCMQYWLAGSDTNVANMIRALVTRYAAGPRAVYHGKVSAQAPAEYPECGVYHPSLPDLGMSDRVSALPAGGSGGSVGLIVGRSYLLARNTALYDAVIAALERRGLRAIATFASALDARPAVRSFLMEGPGHGRVDALINLTGFSLVGGPAYNDAASAREVLAELDVPYHCVQGLEFQSIEGWRTDARGLNPLQATLQVAIPELDGATNPMVVAGKSPQGSAGGSHVEPLEARVELLAARVARQVRLRRTPHENRRVAITLFNFPPNVGNTGSAAYLDVFASLQHTLAALKEAGYRVDLPDSLETLRERVTNGNRSRYGTPANVFATISSDEHVRREVHLAEIERTWGPAPGRHLTDGRSLFVMGERFGNVFVGVQPSFGWEGDPMRLLFEGTFAPTHAFNAYYRWLREDFDADVVLHFGTHGALEFMPGKQVGLSERCWPERLIGDLPNVYLYASNNSSEGTLAKRRGSATLVSYLTPPITTSGLYRELTDLKATVERWRGSDRSTAGERQTLVALLREQAAAVEIHVAPELWERDAEQAVGKLRLQLAEVERALIPSGLHVVGDVMSAEHRAEILGALARVARPDLELPSLLEAIGGHGCAGVQLERAEHGVARVVGEILRTGSAAWARDALASNGWVRHTIAVEGASFLTIAKCIDELARIDTLLRENGEIPGILRALDARYVPPAPGGDLLRSPSVLPTGRNVYGFDPYRVPSAAAVLEGRARAELLLQRYRDDAGSYPESMAFVLWGSDNMKSDGTPLAQALAMIGAVPRFDSVGRLSGARLVPLAQLGRPRIDVVVSVSGVFRDLLPLQIRLLAEAAQLAAAADEPEEQNFVRKHALAEMRASGCDLEAAALRVFGNDDGAYGSNVNLVVEAGTWRSEDELADLFAKRKGYAYGVDGRAVARPELLKASLKRAACTFQNIDSVELGMLDIDQYVESLGGLHRLMERERGSTAPAYVGDHTGLQGTVRSLSEQVAFETRTRTLNPKWYEAQLKSGYEGARNIAARVTTAVGWSATANGVPQWVYRDVAKTFVLDAAMRDRLASANLSAANAMAGRLLEATDRGYWAPDDETLAALRAAAEELEDRIEGVYAQG